MRPLFDWLEKRISVTQASSTHGRHHGAEKKSCAAIVRAPFAASRNTMPPPSVTRHEQDLGRRVGIRDRAADRAPAPRRGVADPRQRLGEEQLPVGGSFGLRLPRGCLMMTALFARCLPARQFLRLADLGRASRWPRERLAPAMTLCVARKQGASLSVKRPRVSRGPLFWFGRRRGAATSPAPCRPAPSACRTPARCRASAEAAMRRSRADARWHPHARRAGTACSP